MFDGLDEVNEEHDRRRQITRALTDFTYKYRKNKFVVTCRVAATDYSFEKFTYVEVADFSESQIITFARKWFFNQRQKGERFLAELEKPEHSRLREIARTPILLKSIVLEF